MATTQPRWHHMSNLTPAPALLLALILALTVTLTAYGYAARQGGLHGSSWHLVGVERAPGVCPGICCVMGQQRSLGQPGQILRQGC